MREISDGDIQQLLFKGKFKPMKAVKFNYDLGNISIAEYMGGVRHKEEQHSHSFAVMPKKIPDWLDGVHRDARVFFVVGDLQYHSSWNWLIPVYSKLAKESRRKKEREEAHIEAHYALLNRFENALIDNDIKAAFRVVVETTEIVKKKPAAAKDKS